MLLVSRESSHSYHSLPFLLLFRFHAVAQSLEVLLTRFRHGV
jgi:hypothetical protein